MRESDSLAVLKGVGEKTRTLFENAGIFQIGQLLRCYPRNYIRYEDPVSITDLPNIGTVTIQCFIISPVTARKSGNLHITTTRVGDETGKLSVVWYRMPYLKKSLQQGKAYVMRGKITIKKQQMVLEHPAVFSVEEYKRLQGVLQPVYPLSGKLTNKMVTKAVRQALDCTELDRDFLPEEIRLEYELAEHGYAYEQIHFPMDTEHLAHARNRMVFDEFFLFLYSLHRLRESGIDLPRNEILEKGELGDKIIKKLPYQLTGAQYKVWEEIKAGMTGAVVMNRLIQGDVGSGKTILAFLAMFTAAENGYQSSLMVPTEVLANQHFSALQELITQQNLPYKAVLLTGSMTTKEKRLARAEIENAEAMFIIGTHALIQDKVDYHNLGLVITDEQHRFGVRQRESLSRKGDLPHVLVMSATPIPRTLGVILYGDLDISVIDQLPANRKPIKNCVVNGKYHPTAYKFILSEIEKGRQAYIICPMVEENENIEAENVTGYTEYLKEVFPKEVNILCLHGKMTSSRKKEIMEEFAENKAQILVSTTVVEVGVNVPNATVMMVENAERFGLAQLHQLRGRVGRGEHQSYCIMVSDSKSQKTKERLEILNRSNDGFFIASEDLKLRGPGDLFGVRQSGDFDFGLGDVFQDSQMLQKASEAVKKILGDSSKQEDPRYNVLQDYAARYYRTYMEKLNL